MEAMFTAALAAALVAMILVTTGCSSSQLQEKKATQAPVSDGLADESAAERRARHARMPRATCGA